MPFFPISSRRFGALAGLVVLTGAALADQGREDHSKEPPLYCKLLAKLPEDQREAYLGTREDINWGELTFEEMKAAQNRQLESLRLELEMDPELRWQIENAFNADHPKWTAEKQALDKRYLENPSYSSPVASEMVKHIDQRRLQMRSDCEPKIG